jgi:hypothetical protein
MEILRSHKINSVENFIKGWYISSKLCDDIVNLCNTKKNQFYSIEKEFPSKTRNYFYSNFYYLKEFNLEKKYFFELDKALSSYKKEYAFSDSVNSYQVGNDYKIQFYEPNESYSIMHCENTGTLESIDRHLVFMTYLNDIDVGGETEFFYQKIKIKPEKGLTLIWPSSWTHTHCGHPSDKKKFIITGWYKFLLNNRSE